MRGADGYNEALSSTVKLEEFVPQTHPLRPIRKWLNEALAKMDTKFSAMYEADVKACRTMNVTPHVAQNTKRTGGSAIDGRTTRHAGYAVSQRKRKRIEQCFGWGKTIGPIRQVMVQGLEKVDQLLTLTMAAYNLTQLRSLAALRPQSA